MSEKLAGIPIQQSTSFTVAGQESAKFLQSLGTKEGAPQAGETSAGLVRRWVRGDSYSGEHERPCYHQNAPPARSTALAAAGVAARSHTPSALSPSPSARPQVASTSSAARRAWCTRTA